MATHYNSEVLPFSLYFEDKNRKPYEVTNLWKKGEQLDVTRLPILKENAKIALQFYVDDSQDYDNKAFCEIQANMFNENNEQISIKQKLDIGNYNDSWIYEGKNEEEFPWRMGVYLLEVYYAGNRYISGIKVLPHHLEESQVEKVHEYLNSQVQDIIYDFVYSKKTPSDNLEQILPKYWYYNYARKLKEKYSEFIYAMTAITKNPREQLDTVYKPSLQHGQLDNKSFRWAVSNKGLAKNARYGNQEYKLIKRKVVNNDSKENQWIKNILQVWDKDVLDVINLIRQDAHNLENKLKSLELEFDNYNDRYSYLKQKNDVGENTKKDVRSQILMTRKGISEIKKQLTVLRSWLEQLRNMNNKIVFFLNNSFLNSVNRGKLKPLLKNFHYYKVDSIFEELKGIKKDEGEQNNLTPILKPTWLIYEYFCLFKIIEYLKNMGFNLIQGINGDLLNLYFEDKIPESAKFIFESEYRVIHIWYDHYHANSAKEAKERGEYFFTPNQKKKPDIKIDSFCKEDKQLTFQGSIVFDAKFSKLKNIYNSNYNTKITEQLSAYYSFFYNGKDNHRGTSIDKVICLYAGEGSSQVEVVHQPITYLKFYPSTEDERYVVGEKELINIIKTLIS